MRTGIVHVLRDIANMLGMLQQYQSLRTWVQSMIVL
jgi:hypothetical protein